MLRSTKLTHGVISLQLALPQIPDGDAAGLVERCLMAAMSTRPLLSMAEGIDILLPSLCMLLPAGLLASALLLRAPRMPLPCPYPAELTGLSRGVSTSTGQGMLAWSYVIHCQGHTVHWSALIGSCQPGDTDILLHLCVTLTVILAT